MRSLRVTTILACVASFSLASVARADEPARDANAERTSALSWLRLEGAEACVPTQELARLVEERLRRKVFVPPAAADLSIEGHVRKVQGRFRVMLIVRDSKGIELGRRELSDASCDALTEPVSLVIALMIDPNAATKEASPPPAAAPRPAEAPPPSRLPDAPVQRAKETPHPKPTTDGAVPLRVEGFATGALVVGRLPNPALSLGASGVIAPGRFPAFEIGASFALPNHVDATLGAQASLWHLSGSVAICPLDLRFGGDARRAMLLLCGGLETGVLHAEGAGFDRNLERFLWTLGARASLPLSVTLAGPLTLRLSPALSVPFLRDELVYRAPNGSAPSVFRMAPIVGTFEAGLGVRFDADVMFRNHQ